jgi:hypothetical protein
MKQFLIFILFLISELLSAQCPTSGNAKTEKERHFNRLKNREIVVKRGSTKITIDSILKDGNDTSRFKSSDYVSVYGYVVEVKDGDAESCNCNSDKDSDHDVHIYIGKTVTAKKEECLVVEITPAFKKANPNFNYKELAGKKVKVKGFLFFDYEHSGNARNTCKKCTNVWRKTAFEIHPVCSISIVNQI